MTWILTALTVDVYIQRIAAVFLQVLCHSDTNPTCLSLLTLRYLLYLRSQTAKAPGIFPVLTFDRSERDDRYMT